MKNITPRIFTFDVMVCETADGRTSKKTVGGPWLRLAKKWTEMAQPSKLVPARDFTDMAARTIMDIIV